jgi:hypothetical protein
MPQMTPPVHSSKFVTSGFGKNKSTRRREKESQKEWRDRREKMLKKLLEARRVEIDNSKADARSKLQEAQGIALQRQADLDSVQRRHQTDVREHLTAWRAPKSARDHLERLLVQNSDLVNYLVSSRSRNTSITSLALLSHVNRKTLKRSSRSPS